MVVGVDYVASELNLKADIGFVLPSVRHSKALVLGSNLSVALANKSSLCVPYNLILIVASIWRLLFSRLDNAVLPQTFQASIACNLRKIAIAQPTFEDLASMALPLSALLYFRYSWLAVAVGSAIHHVLEHFQRHHDLKLSTFSPASTELGECYWELSSESVSVPQIDRCYLSILFVETLGSLVTILLSLLLLCVYVLQRRAVWDIEFGSPWLPNSATICATLSIHRAQFLTNEMAWAQKCHNIQVDILWSFSHQWSEDCFYYCS